MPDSEAVQESGEEVQLRGRRVLRPVLVNRDGEALGAERGDEGVEGVDEGGEDARGRV